MRDEPSSSLIELLGTLRLATPGQVESVAAEVRVLAGELPRFDSVWVDALSQARILTPLQAAEINAGRGAELAIGPYVLCKPLAGGTIGRLFAARHRESGRLVRLLAVEKIHGEPQIVAKGLKQLVESTIEPLPAVVLPVDDAGMDGGRLWAACAAAPGRTAAEWMVENGRFPPAVVMQIARQMAAGLAALERFGRLHGDLHAGGLILQPDGRAVLPHAGIRSLVRPAEGYAFGELAPDAYDTLAPERIREGTAVCTASEVYACGCLWWHLLTGRPPFAGGNTLAKLRSIDAGKLVDVRRLAPDTPDVLAELIAQCMARDPQARPSSISAIAARLGPPTRQGAQALARCLRSHVGWRGTCGFQATRRRQRRSTTRMARLAVTGAILLALFTWPAWRRQWAHVPSQKLAAVEPKRVAEGAGDSPASRVDHQVRPATAVAKATQEPVATAKGRDQSELLLPTDRPLKLQSLKVRQGQTVRGQQGGRPQVFVPRGGLLIAAEDVVLENIDFIWEATRNAGAQSPPRGLIVLAAQRCELRGCTFETRGAAGAPPTAIFWSGPERSTEVGPIGSAELRASECAWRAVGAAVDCHLTSSLAIEIHNSLNVSSGPLVRLNYAPPVDQLVQVSLVHVTLRESRSVLECRYQQLPAEAGSISIQAQDSVLIPATGGALITLAGPVLPQPLLRSLSWSGLGSLCAPEASLALWRNPQGRWQAVDDQLGDVAGLVRSEVTFAGAAEGEIAASRAVEWQAPLRSTQPPGIGPGLSRSAGKDAAGED